MNNYYLLLVFIFLQGCASTMTEGDREYNNHADRLNWTLCENSIIRSPHLYVVHSHNGYRHRRGANVDINMIKDDLFRNKCQLLLGNDHWINHIGK